MSMPSPFPISISNASGSGFIDYTEGAPLPILRVFGWFSSQTLPAFEILTHSNQRVSLLSVARLLRPDVGEHGKESAPFSGFRLDFLIDADDQPQYLLVDNNKAFTFPLYQEAFGTVQPHYGHLFTADKVLGRESIYGSGPPVNVSQEFKEFAGLAKGHVLDFGCGNGDLIEYLTERGCQAEGIELDEPRIHNHLKPSIKNQVTLYQGGQPLPFGDGSFDWIVSTEVIEHVPNIVNYVPEFSRLLKQGGRMLITTPDITSIPCSFPANCVPWHILEATHINFFTPQSVKTLFFSHFELETLYCLGSSKVNGFFVPGSIGAVFVRR